MRKEKEKKVSNDVLELNDKLYLPREDLDALKISHLELQKVGLEVLLSQERLSSFEIYSRTKYNELKQDVSLKRNEVKNKEKVHSDLIVTIEKKLNVDLSVGLNYETGEIIKKENDI